MLAQTTALLDTTSLTPVFVAQLTPSPSRAADHRLKQLLAAREGVCETEGPLTGGTHAGGVAYRVKTPTPGVENRVTRA